MDFGAGIHLIKYCSFHNLTGAWNLPVLLPCGPGSIRGLGVSSGSPASGPSPKGLSPWAYRPPGKHTNSSEDIWEKLQGLKAFFGGLGERQVRKSDRDRGIETERDTELNDYFGFTLKKGGWSKGDINLKSSNYEYRAQIVKEGHLKNPLTRNLLALL